MLVKSSLFVLFVFLVREKKTPTSHEVKKQKETGSDRTLWAALLPCLRHPKSSQYQHRDLQNKEKNKKRPPRHPRHVNVLQPIHLFFSFFLFFYVQRGSCPCYLFLRLKWVIFFFTLVYRASFSILDTKNKMREGSSYFPPHPQYNQWILDTIIMFR